MPRYFFHSEDGQLAYDSEGTELADSAAARIEAVRLAAGLLADRPQLLWESTRWRLLVTDEADLILFTIDLKTIMGVAAPLWPGVIPG